MNVQGLGAIPQVRQATRLYDTQKVYGDRLKAFYSDKPAVVQGQMDSVAISRAASQSFELHRVIQEEVRPQSYSNPRIDNNRKR